MDISNIIEMLQEALARNPPLNQEMLAHMDKLAVICNTPQVESAFNNAVADSIEFTETGDLNPWRFVTISDFQLYFYVWFTDLPKPTGGIGYILPFSWFYNENYSAYYFLNIFRSQSGSALKRTRELFDWVKEFILIRGKFMDSTESTLYLDEWVNDPNAHMEDFLTPAGGFTSFNQFFTRELNMDVNPRPIASPTDDSIVTASADTIINFILSDLTLTTPMNVKGRTISMENLLNKSTYAPRFVGGTAVSCVLMPNVYHHYHAPVKGDIVESMDVSGIYNGIMDGEHWFNDMSNPGQSDTDFATFEQFHRGYYVFKTEKYGHVAMITVGLNTISRITPSMIGERSAYVAPGEPPVPVEKGTKLGHFAYGGSLNILMFEEGVFPCVSLLMGNRLGQMVPKGDVMARTAIERIRKTPQPI